MQLADPGSLALLTLLVQQHLPSSSLLLMVTEAAAQHSGLTTTASTQSESSVWSTHTMDLCPLSLDGVVAMVARITHMVGPACDAVASALHERSGGNPQLVKQMLQQLYDSRDLRFCVETGDWALSMDALETMQISDSSGAAASWAVRLEGLSPETQVALVTCACMGDGSSIASVSAAVPVCGGCTPSGSLSVCLK